MPSLDCFGRPDIAKTSGDNFNEPGQSIGFGHVLLCFALRIVAHMSCIGCVGGI